VRACALAGSVAVLGALAVADAAMAAKAQQAKFKVEISGQQDSDWTYDSTDVDDCTGATNRTFGSGGQSFSFTTPKPVKMTAIRNKIGGDHFTAIYQGKPTDPDPSVPVNVAAIREGSIQTQQVAPGEGEPCGDGGGPGTAPQPDCGERSFDGKLNLAYYEPEFYPGEPTPLVPVLTLAGPFDANNDSPLAELWTNCPGPANDHAGLMETPTGGLPPNKLFGKKKKFKVQAKDSDAFTSSSTQQTTKLGWTAAFKRLK
jgi:hypothetical protein